MQPFCRVWISYRVRFRFLPDQNALKTTPNVQHPRHMRNTLLTAALSVWNAWKSLFLPGTFTKGGINANRKSQVSPPENHGAGAAARPHWQRKAHPEHFGLVTNPSWDNLWLIANFLSKILQRTWRLNSLPPHRQEHLNPSSMRLKNTYLRSLTLLVRLRPQGARNLTAPAQLFETFARDSVEIMSLTIQKTVRSF